MTRERTGGGQGLARGALRPMNVLAIAVAAISPTTSVFLVFGAGIATAGTGVVAAFAIGAVIAIAMALCYAEVGSLFPSAGGAYTIVRRALGPIGGGVVNVLFLVLGVVVTASILVAAATYLQSLAPALPVNWTAFAMMAIITLLSLDRISPTSWMTAAMLVLELAVITVFAIAAFAHPALPGRLLVHPVVPIGSKGVLGTVGLSAVLIAVVPALFAYNGYDWPLYFAEETTDRRALPRAVLLAVGISVLFELAAVVAATLAIHGLAHTAQSASPLSLIADRVMGPTGAKILLVGVIIAMFDTGLAGNLAYARIYYASGRDEMWPLAALNRFFAHVSPRTKVPTWGFLVLFVGNGILAIFTSLNNLITFTGVIIVTIYLLVAVSALVARVRERRSSGVFRMPLWPVPAVVAIGGVVLALSQQSKGDLIITAVIVVVGVVVTLARRGASTLGGAPVADLPMPEDHA
ncbi:amino acid permease-associated region [Acidimicrobium ferrooxidans DSM 10331]|uniref:Amino acid permease-associated region n=1 Tax=Acidimicrobium ferrooxidans (strain DSM 10331 / JCM 15462 / NBRC 103882 / ICP) TaxID=525909 RepID=C7LZU3_ACIFD|nr:APC family permease [Acidimicrobium ferrooxidans]ACU54251.1 amino acid permease-associated region [Acidimicrobium ferrooxidans DSM 10331]